MQTPAPRNPIAAFFCYCVGFFVTAAGSAVLGLSALALVDREDARLWLVELLPLARVRLTAPVDQIAYNMTQDAPVVLFESVIGAFVLASGLGILWSARRAMRPASQSGDDRFEVSFEQPPQVGRLLVGRLSFLKRPEANQVYRVDLTCSRDYTEDGHDRRDVAFSHRADVRPVLTARGWSLPFSFDIPALVPASRAVSEDEYGFHHWRMTISRPGKSLSRNSRLTLRMAADPRKPSPREPLTDDIPAEAVRAWREMDPRLHKPLAVIIGSALAFLAAAYALFQFAGWFDAP